MSKIRAILLGLGVTAVVATGVVVVGSSAIAAERPAAAGRPAQTTAVQHDTAGERDNVVGARLIGFAEVPSKLSNGSGTFEAALSGDQIRYRLTYSGLTASPGNSPSPAPTAPAVPSVNPVPTASALPGD